MPGPNAQQKQGYVMRMMMKDPARVLAVVVANTTAQQRNSIISALVPSAPEEELAGLIAFRDSYVGGDTVLFDAVEARIAQLQQG